jgi:hypothetical protein
MIKASQKANLQYWTKNDKVKNLGDYLGEVLLKLANIKVCDRGSPVYLSVGTSLSSYWWHSCPGPKVAWGSGSCGFDFPDISEDDAILAVRGPLTVKWLGLPSDTPLGDPALLLPRIYSPKDMNCGPLLVENFHSDIEVPPTKINVIKKISMKVFDGNWRVIVDKIYSSDFVLANSLHSAIIAQAYGKPWAFYLDDKSKQPLPLRWKDWFAFLGLSEDALKPVDSLIGAIKWWDENQNKIKPPKIESLIGCCPWSTLRRILK